MSQETINNGETGLSVRTKLNANFTDLYTADSERALLRSVIGDELATLSGVPFETMTGRQDNRPTLGGPSFSSSIFRGFQSRIGIRQNFDAISFYLAPFDSSNLPTFVNVKVRLGSRDGAIVAQVNVPIDNAVVNREYFVTANLGTLIENSDGQQVWLQYHADGFTGVRLSTTTLTNEAGVDQLQWTNSSAISDAPFTSTAANDPNQIFAITHRTGVTNIWDVLGTWAQGNASGTFTGWGNVMSSVPTSPFNVVHIPIRAFDAANLPTRIRLTFRENNHTGNVIATAYADMHFTGISTRWAIFSFPSPITLTGTVWAEIQANGRIARPGASVATSANGRYSTLAGVDCATSTPLNPATSQVWMRTLLRPASTQPGQLTLGLLRREAAALAGAAATPFIPICRLQLPPNIYAVEGVETNIYWDGIFDSWLKPSQFNIRVNCAKGRHDDERWRIVPSASGYAPGTGTDIGNHAMTVEANYNGQLIASATTTIRVKAANTGEGVSRKALFIGDSTLAGGEVTAQVLDQVTANPSTYSLTLLGTQGSNPNRHESNSGKSYNWFRTNASSPFVFSGSFNFAQYLTNNSYTMASGDHVFFLLGINDMFSAATDTAAESAATSVGADIAAMITNIQAAVSGIRIWLGLVIPPSRNQSAFGNNYTGSAQYRDRYNRNINILRNFLITTYGASATVFLAPVNCNLDTVNNMQTASQPVNSQNAATTTVQTNGVHPALSGYKQIGDMCYCCLMSQES